MRAFILWSYLIFVHVFVLSAQQTSQFGDLGNGMFRNPVIPSDYSDPDIIRVGEDYYGIASTFCFSPGNDCDTFEGFGTLGNNKSCCR